jgi:hypothetical protein
VEHVGKCNKEVRDLCRSQSSKVEFRFPEFDEGERSIHAWGVKTIPFTPAQVTLVQIIIMRIREATK